MATELRAASTKLYDADFYVWAVEQAELLRAGRFDALDLDHLIEEVEGLADTKLSAVRNSARVVMDHLLKLQCSPASDPRNGWRASAREPRRRVETDLTPRIARSSPTSCRGSAGWHARTHKAGMRDTASTMRPTRCPGPLPTVWIRSPATGGREAGTRLSRSAALSFRRIPPSGTDRAARPARRP